MQAVLDAFSLKALTKALTCLSKFGDELSVYATPDSLTFSATNSAKSAYSRFKYDKAFFSRYRLGNGGALDQMEEDPMLTGQLLTKSLLAILRHRTVEKSVERCEILISEGQPGHHDSDEEDSLESRFTIRLHCKHGVVKTHRLTLSVAVNLMAPEMPDPTGESRLTIGPKPLRDLIEHFPISRSAKADPQLVWTFEDTQVGLRTLESSIDSRGRGQLNTELTISAREFEGYEIFSAPTTIAFHLREFSATIAFADAMSLDLDLRFTDPAAPLFIEVGADSADIIFVISTSQVFGAPVASQNTQNTNGAVRKRPLDEPRETPRIKKPMKAAQPMDIDNFPGRSRASSRVPGSMPPPSFLPRPSDMGGYGVQPLGSSQGSVPQHEESGWVPPSAAEEPLFLPSSQVGEEALHALGMQVLNEEELATLLEDEGEEVEELYLSQQPAKSTRRQHSRSSAEVHTGDDARGLDQADGGEFDPSQSSFRLSKAFRPLFED